MIPLRVAFSTLGCKLNQLESEAIADAFSSAGAQLSSFGTAAELYVLNTCTVTGKAEQKARHAVRQAQSNNPDSVVLVTGCYAQMDPESLSRISPRVVVISGDEKAGILGLAGWLQDNWQGHGDLLDAVHEWKRETMAGEPGKAGARISAESAGFDRFAFQPKNFAFHSRPSLKIQDGCDNRCAYCRVCVARGPSVSLDPTLALARARELEAAGKAEVVITGVNLSQYRWGNMKFPGLLSSLVEGTRKMRFRLSSWEPDQVDEAFLEALSLERVQPHVHLSLQSGSDTVLRRMARPYTAARVRDAVKAIRSVKDDPFLAADIIAGFPGETDAEFEESFCLLEELDLAYIHAFPFSARPGTWAWDMKPKIPERVAGERVSMLGDLARRGKAAYVGRCVGRIVPLVLERGGEGTSANYLKLSLSGTPEDLEAGTLVRGLVSGPCADGDADAEAEYREAPSS
jgi:threonylcarbamoyladenosine tRNA methylthiotransferase MtaB